MMVVGIDPGPNTGFFIVGGPIQQSHVQQPGLRNAGVFLSDVIKSFFVDVVVFEDFNIKDKRASNGPDTKDCLDVIGAMKYICLTAGHDITVVRRWNTDKRKIVDEMLEERGWLARPLNEWRHANDAARHVLGWSLKEGVSLT